MGLLDRTAILWGVGIAVALGIACILVAPMMGLDAASLLIGLLVGLAAAAGYLILRVLEPIERGINGLNDGSLADNHPLRAQCAQLLADARAGKALVETLSASADKSAISAAEVSFAADQVKQRLDRQEIGRAHV